MERAIRRSKGFFWSSLTSYSERIMSCCCIAFWSLEASVGEKTGIFANLRVVSSCLSAEHWWKITTLKRNSCSLLLGNFALISCPELYHLLLVFKGNLMISLWVLHPLWWNLDACIWENRFWKKFSFWTRWGNWCGNSFLINYSESISNITNTIHHIQSSHAVTSLLGYQCLALIWIIFEFKFKRD